MGVEFEEWTVGDSILMTKLFSFVLSTNWQLTPMRGALVEKFGQELADRILPISKDYHFLEPLSILKGNGETSQVKVNASSFNDSIYNQMRGKKTTQGSNSWVVHGNYTATGKPMLASDPHLGHEIPSGMYIMSMKFPKGPTLIGSTIAGITRELCVGIDGESD
jgi:penicillin amidase